MSRTAARRKKVWLITAMLLLLLLAALLTGGGILLKKGIRSDGFSVGPAVLTGVGLQWQDKLVLQVEAVHLELQSGSGGMPEEMSFIDTAVRIANLLDFFFQEISVKSVKVGGLTGSLSYDGNSAAVVLAGKDFTFHSRVYREHDILRIEVEDLSSATYRSKASGQIRLHLQERQLTGSLAVDLAGCLPVALQFTADREKISFSGTETAAITTITPFVDLFGLSHNIQRWITEYLSGSRYNLKTFRGSFPWNDPMQLMETFYAEVRVDDCQYTFAPGLEPIKTDYTDVVFKEGVLLITPHDSTFYSQDGEDSWLDINFNDPVNIVLTAYILTHAVANEDIQNLLQYYGISLPFKQTAGKTGTDLTLAINLNETELSAQGLFLIEKGAVLYEGKLYDVQSAEIKLNNTTISLKHLLVSYEDLFSADISGDVQLTEKTGDLDIAVQKVAVKAGELLLALDKSQPAPKLQYHIRPDGLSVSATESFWDFDGFLLKVEAFTTPFSFQDLSGVLPATRISVPPLMEVQVSGPFSIKKRYIDLQCELLQHSIKGIVLEQERVPFRLQYDSKFTLQPQDVSRWSLNSVPLTLYSGEFDYTDKKFIIVNSRISYAKFFDSQVAGEYDFKTNNGNFLLNNLQLKKEDLGNLFSSPGAVAVEVDGSKGNLIVRIPEFGMEISTGKNKSWSASVIDLSVLHRHSTLLQRYRLDNGSLTVSSENGEMPYLFSAEISYPYPFLIENGKPVKDLTIVGRVLDKGVEATINNKVKVIVGEKLSIFSKGVSYNTPAIIDFMRDRPLAKEGEKKGGLNVAFGATDAKIYFTPDSFLPADQVTFNSTRSGGRLQLEQGAGEITMDIEGDTFSLSGKDLDDVFMNALSTDAHVEGGSMGLAAYGGFDDFSVVLKVTDIVLKDFKTMNNILAMVNTIPALITFTLPEYNTKGLPVTSGVAAITVKDGFVATFKVLDIDSPEISLTGKGWIDFPNKQIDMEMNLITQAKENMQKIPLVGYILAGKEKQPSITVKVSGDLLDPEVESEMFKEVVTMPFSILYRTLALPAHLASPLFESDDDTEAEGEPVEQ